MTYIRPEAVPNQSLNPVQTLIQMGLAAAEQQDWLSVNNYLKQLPLNESRNREKTFVLSQKEWQMAFDLAILMLLNADFQHKWSIIKILPWFGEDIIPTLTTLIKDTATEADVRWFICQTLGSFSNGVVVLTLVELLGSTTDKELVEMAGKTLTKIGDDAIEALEGLLSKPQHRSLAVQSLYYIRTAKTIEPLISVVNDPQPELRAIAIKALGSFHDSRIPPILINALQDKASQVRQEAAIALGFRPDVCDKLNLIDHLRPLLLDFDLEVCRQAAVALCRMKNKTATAALFEVLQTHTTPINLKLDIVKALSWSEISSANDYLAQALFNSTAIITAEIVTVLGRTTLAQLKPQAAQALVKFWQSKSPQLQSPALRQTLATSLGELRCDFTKNTLEQLTEDGDRKVKLYAISALKKISPKLN